MKNVIVGTAGHIDHGKTCLIRALTNIETDRLKEEKQRGITIELGFADLENDRGMDIGIIDVPGHEKFVKHMLAGVSGMDVVLLVVAADESFMPQTKEHFEILKMLKIGKGIVVLTKIDMVDEDWIEVVKDDIAENVKGTFLEGAPVVAVSSHTGEGIDGLREMILDMAQECGSRKEEPEILRLPIDRVFTIDGFGTVITGTLMEGSVAPGDEVMLYPSQIKVKVRNVQVHGDAVDRAVAGQRTAINLAGIKKNQINRGDVLAYPGLLENTRMIDVRIDMFDKTERMIKSGSRLHFHYGSAETLCKAVLLNEEAIGEGQSCYAQLRFEEEIAVKRGDRFILRFYSPTETIGGGIILDAAARKKKRFDEKVINALKLHDEGDECDILEQLLREESYKLSDESYILNKFGAVKSESEALLSELLEKGTAVNLAKEFTVHRDYIEYVKEKAGKLLTEYHEDNPVSAGMPKEEFRNKMATLIRTEDMKKIEILLNMMLEANEIEEISGIVKLKNFTVEYTPQQEKQVAAYEKIFREAAMEPPLTDDLIAGEKNKKAHLQLLDSMCVKNRLKKLNYQYYIDVDCFEKAMNVLMDTLKANGRITLGEYRDLIGTSRKYAIMFLEYADENKITRKIDDYRVMYNQEK